MTLFEAVHAAFRRLHRSPRTEEAYTHWIRALIRYHRRRHPRDLTAADVTAFLNHLAVERRASASTQNQALCAIVFLYRHVLGLPMPELLGLERCDLSHYYTTKPACIAACGSEPCFLEANCSLSNCCCP
jgi:hypothetical protein